jgi:hypothetical protein
LTAFLEATYERHYTPPLRFVLQFDDGEDLCSISSEAELQEGLSLHAASGAGGCFKLLAAFDTQPLQQSIVSLSGMSTPSVMSALSELPVVVPSNLRVQEPPSPQDAEIVQAPSTSAPSVNDDDGAESDDEYERVEEEAHVKQEPVVAAPAVAAPEKPQPVAAEAEKASPPPPAAAAPVEVAPAAAAAPSKPVEASSSSPSPAIHVGVRCDQCSAYPIVGTRFHCVTCGPADGGFDLCARCEATSEHVYVMKHQFKVMVEAVDTSKAQEESDAAQAAAAQAAEVVAAAAAAAAPTGPAVHEGITCDGCAQTPLIGVRYRCKTCEQPGGFDLCAKC